MQINEKIACTEFPCPGVRHAGYVIPNVAIDPEAVSTTQTKLPMSSLLPPQRPSAL